MANAQEMVFQYTRGKGQGEKRLHAKRSIGIGGHICWEDESNEAELHPYEEGMRRELAEEVHIETAYQARLAGMINDDLTEVGKVHLGVVHVFDVRTPDIRPREPEIMDAGFRPVAELLRQVDQFESWSQICLRALFGQQ
jgi:predicted NUDIX family phosphoesterase